MANSPEELWDSTEKGKTYVDYEPAYSLGASLSLALLSLGASFGLFVWNLKFDFRDFVLVSDYAPITPRNEVIGGFLWPLIILVMLSTIPMILAIVLGHIDFRNARRHHLRQGKSLAGLIFGYIALPFAAFMVFTSVNSMISFILHAAK